MATKSSRTGFDREKDPGLKDVDRLKDLMPNLKIVVMPKINRMTVPTDPAFIKSATDFLPENFSIGSGIK